MSLPNPKTRFFGRDEDLAKLEALCHDSPCLVTLWGPPGIGKTRLAIELCRRSPSALFCDLSTAQTPADLCARLGETLGVPSTASVDVPQIGVALAARAPGVLALDNFEQLAPYAARTLGKWIDAAPQLRFVTTSRERLHIDGEITHEVPPLHQGLELFLDRLPRRDGLDPDLVATLVARLEGIPLAIELAAARADVLGVDGLLARLDRPLEVLGHEGVLRRTIESSLHALDAREKHVLAQCAVFRGRFTVDEAEAVIARPDVRVLDALHTLRDRSLLRCVADGGSVRFVFFDSIRACAAEALEDETRRRHALHCLERPFCDDTNLTDAVTWTLADETMTRDHVKGAIECLARIEPSLLSDALVELLGRALALAPDGDPLVRARGHRTRGRALAVRGKVAEARAELERARRLAEGDPILTAEIWADVGVIHHQMREMELARECYETAAALNDNPVAKARYVGNLGAVDHDMRHFDAALSRYQEAIAVFQATGQAQLEGTFLGNMAVLLQEMGASSRARATYVLALERLKHTRDRRLEAITRTNLGLLCHELGDLEEARACHEQALVLLRRVSDGRSEALCLGRLAMALSALGHHHDAQAQCDRAERILRGAEDRHALEVLELFRAYVDLASSGDVALTRERLARARSLVARCDDARTTVRLIESVLARARGDERVLVVGPEACWFTPPGGEPLDLSSRHVLRRLLWRLIERHRAAPGEGLTLDDLRDAGWPGEQATRVAALNRVHVALTELRRRGLRSCLQRNRARYLLDPALRVELRDH